MLTNKSLCVVLELCQSYELWHWMICTPVVLALSYLLSLLCSLILSIHYTSRQHFTSSKSGIISCTWRCTWKGQDQNWNMREQTFDSTNAAPSPFSCATSLQVAATIKLSFLDRGWTIDNGQWTLWSQWKWIQPCPQVLGEHAEWHEAILLPFKAKDQPERIPSECFSSWNRRRHWDITLRYMKPYLGKQEEEQLLQVAKWDKKFSAVYFIQGTMCSL